MICKTAGHSKGKSRVLFPFTRTLVILALLECVWSRLANWKDVELMGRFQPDG